MPDRKNVPCRYFAAGNCRFGAQCAFSHDPSLVSNTASTSSSSTTPTNTSSTSTSTASAAAPAAAPAVVTSLSSPSSSPLNLSGNSNGVLHVGGAAAVPTHAAPVLIALQPGVPVFSIDVECVATGTQHNSRATGQIALVDQFEEPILNLFVSPTDRVVSYLTPLSGLTKEKLDKHGIALDDAMKQLRSRLPRNSILVGQNIAKDVEWLGLKEGEDFAAMIDLAALLRVWNERYHSFTYFGLSHAAKCWLGVRDDGATPAAHDAVTDAQRSVRLFNLYCRLQHSPAELASMQQLMLATTVAPSFAKLHPTYEGCCMGNRKTCECGAPFLN